MRRLIRSSAVTSLGSLAGILSGIVKGKVLAILVGPAGIGLLGLLQSVQTTAAVVAGLGLADSSIRTVAALHAGDDHAAVARTRSALLRGVALVAAVAALLIFALSSPLASCILGDAGRFPVLMWLAVSILPLSLSEAQGALLNGLRRIGEIATIRASIAVAGMLVAIG
jgi:O-antigen/teichoic acid export membrane protein